MNEFPISFQVSFNITTDQWNKIRIRAKEQKLELDEFVKNRIIRSLYEKQSSESELEISSNSFDSFYFSLK